MNYSSENYQQQQQQASYDPSYQYYDPSANNYQYNYQNVHQIPYQNAAVQEPNPPGVSQPQSYYYQYPPPTTTAVMNVGPHQGGIEAGVAPVHHQPIFQSSYGVVGSSDGRPPHDNPGAHFGPEPNVWGVPFRGQARGRGRGRVRGRGRERAIHKQPTAPIQDQTTLTEGPAHVHAGPPQTMSQPYSSTLSTVQMPFPVQPQSAPVPPKVASCELCKVDCNSAEILEQHKNGKKHKKKLKVFEDLQKSNLCVVAAQIEHTSTSELRSIVPSQPDQSERSGDEKLQPESLPSQAVNEESKVLVEKQKVEEVEPTEASVENARVDHSEGRGRGLKRKMKGGGRGGKRVKPFNGSKRPVEPPKPKENVPLICELCNVKCESTVVFQSHLVGKKHQSKAKRFMGHQELLGQEILRLLSPAIQALCQQNPNASTSIIPQLHQLGFGALQGAPIQNTMAVDMQAPTSETNGEKGLFEESISQQQHFVNTEGKPENQVVTHCPSGSSVIAQMEGVHEPVISETAVDGASVFQQSMALLPSHGPDNSTQ